MNKDSLKEDCATHRTGMLEMNVYDNFLCDSPCHWHDEYEFILPRKGLCPCVVNGERFNIQSGDMLLVQAGELHAIGIKPANFHFAIVFHPHLCGSDCSKFFEKNINFKRLFSSQNPCEKEIIKSATDIVETFKRKDFGYELKIKSLITGIFSTMLENKMYSETPQKYNNLDTFEKMINYIHTNFSEKITLDMLSEFSHYSKNYVIQLFKTNTGKTPVDYINSYRIYKAQELLKHSDKSITDISLECGFVSIGYFIKLFSKCLGTTPNQWRKNKI